MKSIKFFLFIFILGVFISLSIGIFSQYKYFYFIALSFFALFIFFFIFILIKQRTKASSQVNKIIKDNFKQIKPTLIKEIKLSHEKALIKIEKNSDRFYLKTNQQEGVKILLKLPDIPKEILLDELYGGFCLILDKIIYSKSLKSVWNYIFDYYYLPNNISKNVKLFIIQITIDNIIYEKELNTKLQVLKKNTSWKISNKK